MRTTVSRLPAVFFRLPKTLICRKIWDYAIVPVGAQPEKYDGKILVPFAVESSLSGVQKRLGGENELWYSREFAVPAKWAGERVLLHFGAVDWKTDVWVNDVLVGRHTVTNRAVSR